MKWEVDLVSQSQDGVPGSFEDDHSRGGSVVTYRALLGEMDEY